jgi:hypothetical protein
MFSILHYVTKHCDANVRLQKVIFVCGFFNDADSSEDYTVSNDKLMNNSLERIRKEEIVDGFKALSRHFTERTEKSRKNQSKHVVTGLRFEPETSQL